MNLSFVGVLAGIGSAASWAIGAILFKQIGSHLSPLVMTLGKSGLGVLYLGLALAVTCASVPAAGDLWMLAASGLVGIAISDTLFFAALRDLSPKTLVILLTVGQVNASILAMIFLGEFPSTIAWLGIGLILTGVSIVLWPTGGTPAPPARRKGILLGLASSLCMSGSVVMAKDALADVSALEGTFIRMLAGFVGIALVLAFRRRLLSSLWDISKQGLALSFLAAVFVVTFGGFWLSLVAVKNLNVAAANSLLSLEPVLILPFAAFFLKEKLLGREIAGAIIATAGVIVLSLSLGHL